MHYLLHAPRNSIVFTTTNSSISRFLRRQHNWAGVKTECSTLPEYISTLCIRELENGEVEVDDEVLNGDRLAEEIRFLLMRDGFAEPDLRFVGRIARSRHLMQVGASIRHDGAASSEWFTSWYGDGLSET
jgi:hypothetical protein